MRKRRKKREEEKEEINKTLIERNEDRKQRGSD